MLNFDSVAKFVLNGKIEDVFNGSVLRKSDRLIKVRLWMYCLAFVHLVLIAFKLLTVDFTKAEDPSLWIYEDVRWKLITCWFNLLFLVYFPICIYCDWMELRGETTKHHIKGLNRVRYYLFTSILFPTITFSDILFWRLWVKDRELLAPRAVDKFVPFWTQHCMHTVSLVVIVLDLIMVPRKRPRSFVNGLALLGSYAASYIYVGLMSYSNGVCLYPFIKIFNEFDLVVLVLYFIVGHLFYYFAQFVITDIVWGKDYKEN